MADLIFDSGIGDLVFDDPTFQIDFIGNINPFIEVDYLAEARSRYTEQFKRRPIFDKYIQLLLAEKIELQRVLRDLMQNRTLDTAAGAQLDVIGRIVGQPRDLVDSTIIYYFGFQGASGAQSFGNLSDSSIGGKWWSLTQPLQGTRTLNDEEYRTLIKIKILKNNSKGSMDQFLQAAILLFGVPMINYTETPAGIEINIGRDFNDPDLAVFKGLDEIALARRYLPIPLGVKLTFDGTIL